MRLILPQRQDIEKSHDDDPLDFYYRPISGLVYRRRLAMGLELLGEGPFGLVLEIGYGSGILLPELARRARVIHGVDIHGKTDLVEGMLQKVGVAAELRVGDIFALPYADGLFDAVVCLSVMEHLTELDKACAEIRRVLKHGAVAIIGFPVRNVLTTALFRCAGYDASEIHPSSHQDIMSALGRAFVVERMLRLPALLPMGLGLYAVCRCRKN